MSDESKAVQEAAKAVTKSGEVLLAAGGWMANVLGTLPQDILGLGGGDLIHEVRVRNLDRLKRRTAEILEARRVSPDRQAVRPNILIPIAATAADESREELQELFARLLANALDPNTTERVRPSFIGTLKSLDPIDALLFKLVIEAPTFGEWSSKLAAKFPGIEKPPASDQRVLEGIWEKFTFSKDEWDYSRGNLSKLDCVKNAHFQKWGEGGDDHFRSIWKQLDSLSANGKIDVEELNRRTKREFLTATIPVTGRLLGRALEL